MGGLRDLHPIKGEKGFAWRGAEPTRVEALSDMVFAFAVTLLVVSSEPPTSLAELNQQLWGFPGFAAAFAILLVVWHAHYIFFRRYALTDTWTTVLNSVLLFLILFFVYPLKYHATMLSLFVLSIAEGQPKAPMTFSEASQALVILGIAYAAVFFTFAALYGHALRRTRELQLDEHETRLTRFSFWQQIIQASVGTAVAIGASQPVWWAPMSGFLFCLIGPLIFAASAIILRPPKTSEAATS